MDHFKSPKEYILSKLKPLEWEFVREKDGVKYFCAKASFGLFLLEEFARPDGEMAYRAKFQTHGDKIPWLTREAAEKDCNEEYKDMALNLFNL